jgi:2-methylisocitrate lyase-like PEP mutase family enzyme
MVAPGACDALSARLIEIARFDTAYMAGFGTAVFNFGVPDIGLLTMPEAVENAKRISDSVEILLIADVNTGYGNHLNDIRTMGNMRRRVLQFLILRIRSSPKDVDDIWRDRFP